MFPFDDVLEVCLILQTAVRGCSLKLLIQQLNVADPLFNILQSYGEQ